jgi:hypothetical protein
MLRISARSEQKNSTERHPLSDRAGRDAAELWLLAAPFSMADFRDLRFRNFIAGETVFGDHAERRDAFNTAFASRIALFIAQQSREVAAHV